MQVFGITNHNMAKEWGELLGMRAAGPGSARSWTRQPFRYVGKAAWYAGGLITSSDKAFAGLFDANPRFALQGGLQI